MRGLQHIAFVAVLLVPAAAAAEFHDARQGRVAIGGSVGGGSMSIDNDVVGCPGCEYGSVGYEVDVHFGTTFSPRQAVMFEIQLNMSSVEDNELHVSSFGSQAVMLATQYWLTRPLWIKGGYGFATTQRTKDEDNVRQHGPTGSGFAFMAAAGYEVVSAPRFAVDVQTRLIAGLGEGVNAASIGVGVNWY